MTDQPAVAGRTLVVCLDGTSNEPESGTTNVARMFQVVTKDEGQLAYYDPGVGTMGSRGAVTPLGRKLSRAAGLVAGFGIKDNIEEAYTWLARHYEPGDQLYVFGFSRGAYTARALTGMLATVGLLRSGAENLVPYAVKLYAQSGKDSATPEEEKAWWKVRRDFSARFGNPAFPSSFETVDRQVRFLGVWDTVKSVGWLNWKAQLEQARWPFTAAIRNVDVARHALAIDERRRPYKEYRFAPEAVAASGGRYQEMWFAGVHSDVGGLFLDDHRLADVSFAWMVQEAVAAGLRVDARAYRRLLQVKLGEEPDPGWALGALHPAGGAWRLLGTRRRPIQLGDLVHPSVHERIARDASYRPRLP